MAKRVVKLTFPQDLVKEPLTFQMAKKYNILPNIRRAKVTETSGELVLELEGKEEDLDKGVEFLKKAGVIVESVVGNVL
ncbi:ferredoxin, partial [bacterium]